MVNHLWASTASGGTPIERLDYRTPATPPAPAGAASVGRDRENDDVRQHDGKRDEQDLVEDGHPRRWRRVLVVVDDGEQCLQEIVGGEGA